MQQPQGQQDPTSLTPLVTPGFAEPLTFAHQRVFPHLDTLFSDHQEEVLPEEEVEEDSQEEVIPAGVAASQVEEDQEDQEDLPRILWEDIKETD